MSISSTGLYGSATIVNSDLFTDVETHKETVTTLNTTYLQTTQEHRQDISLNLSKIDDISNRRIVTIEQDISSNAADIDDISNNRIVTIEQDISSNVCVYGCIRNFSYIYIHICIYIVGAVYGPLRCETLI